MVMREEELRLEAEKTERYISLSKGKPAPNCLSPLSNCEHVRYFQSLAPRQHLAKESKPFPSPQSPPIPTSSTRNTAAASRSQKRPSRPTAWFPPIDTNRYKLSKRESTLTLLPPLTLKLSNISRRSPHRSTLPVPGRSAPISAFAPKPTGPISIDQLNKGCSDCCRPHQAI